MNIKATIYRGKEFGEPEPTEVRIIAVQAEGAITPATAIYVTSNGRIRSDYLHLFRVTDEAYYFKA